MCRFVCQPLQPLQLQVRPPALYAVSAALLMLGEVAEPPKAWRSLGPRLGKKDARGNRLPWRRRLLKRMAAFDPLGMSEVRVERVQALLDLLPQAQVELVINVPFLLAKHTLVAVRLWRLARLPATSQEGDEAMELTTGLVRSQAMAANGLRRPSARTTRLIRPPSTIYSSVSLVTPAADIAHWAYAAAAEAANAGTAPEPEPEPEPELEPKPEPKPKPEPEPGPEP